MPHGAGVLLASLPVASARYPSLALGLLKQALADTGVACDVRYFSLDHTASVGTDTAECLEDLRYYSALVGEWVFAPGARGAPADELSADDMAYLHDVFRQQCPAREFVARLILLLAAREQADSFIERCFDQVDWGRVAVLGISTSFQQNMASLALARRVKARHPNVLIVFGGANCQGEMGVELHRRYGFVDAVCLGEGDLIFPELVRRHLAGEDCGGLPGIVLRAADGSSIVPARETEQIEDLDALPYPDLSDFYDQRRALPTPPLQPAAVVFETARGCWWGAKHHCTFCGLNGRTMAYRSKSQARAYAEVAHLVGRYGRDLVNADAILDLRYFDEFMPRLAAEGPDVTVFWQMKANLRPEQLTMLSRAGVKRIQPGIEALDTALLTLMDKGCTMLQNVQLLKLAAENGLSVAWNLLHGFPGETAASYVRTARIIPNLLHLQPPYSTGRVFADRFSPYFQRPESFHVRLEPAPAYRHVHGFEADSVRRLAYHFHMRSDALERAEELAAPMKAAQQLWSDHHRESELYSEDDGGDLVVTDARWGRPRTVLPIRGLEAELLRQCWRIMPRHRLMDGVRAFHDEGAVSSALRRLVELGLLLQEKEEFLALPLRQPGCRRAPAWEDIIERRIEPYALRLPAHAGGQDASGTKEISTV